MGAARRLCLPKESSWPFASCWGTRGLGAGGPLQACVSECRPGRSDQPYWYELDRLLLGHLSETGVLPNKLRQVDELESGKRESFELRRRFARCLHGRVMAYKDATDNATRPDLYEQLHIMVEVWT